ncbi:hypothetical protein N7449_012238 [Penicillium cf. viridicatum]|uniref:NTF2 domain-containing protein n=1 Tax=Penicillium cf. viridicatum TaxID=2972119 RepID=A0A9W9IRF4_9EURO|nr:hypothetical protein N7449_012238 [Penicillium cf. viridicatum]
MLLFSAVRSLLNHDGHNLIGVDNASSLLLASSFLFVLFWGLPLLIDLFISPARNIPGPFWSRITRWWEYRAVVNGDSNQLYMRLHDKYGPTVRVGPNRYSFSRPEDVKLIYELGGKFSKTQYYDTLSPTEREKQNIFTIRENNYHKERRKKIATLYTMSTMVSYEEAVDKMTKVCVRKMRQFADENRLISIPDFMQYYAFDVIGEITVCGLFLFSPGVLVYVFGKLKESKFDQNFGMMEKEGDTTGMIKGIHKANDYLAHMGVVYNLHPWKKWLDFVMRKKDNVAVLISYTLTQIARYRNAATSTTGSKDVKYESFLKKLLSMEAEKKIDSSNIMDSCGSNIGAGSDTTAITLSASLFYLYRNPEKLDKLRHEIDTQAAKGQISDPVTYQEAHGMPYLQAVIKETLRLHPAVGTILARSVPQGGVHLGGYYFPEGTEVGSNAWVLHYNKEIYGPDANVYMPERWLDMDKSSTRESMFLAFGAGSRTCIGKNISMLEMSKLLPQIVRNFDITYADKMCMVRLSQI